MGVASNSGWSWIFAMMEGETRFTAQEMRDLRLMYDIYDPSNNDSITIRDLRKLLKVLGFKCLRHRLREIMTQEDIGKNDTMSFRETLNVVHCLQYDSYDTHEEITQAFSYMDCDCDGQISFKDIQSISRSVGMKLTSADIQGMIEEGDKNGDGLISMEEFIQLIQQTSLYN